MNLANLKELPKEEQGKAHVLTVEEQYALLPKLKEVGRMPVLRPDKQYAGDWKEAPEDNALAVIKVEEIDYEAKGMAIVEAHVEVLPVLIRPPSEGQLWMESHANKEQRAVARDVLARARETQKEQLLVLQDVTQHLDVMKIMLFEMEDMQRKCGAVESNYRAAQKHWKQKWTKIYDYKYLKLVQAHHAKHKNLNNFGQTLAKKKILLSEAYKGKPFMAGGSKNAAGRTQEEIERLVAMRKVGSLTSPKKVGSLSKEMEETMKMTQQKSVSSPDFTAHLLRQVEPKGRPSLAIGMKQGEFIDFTTQGNNELAPLKESESSSDAKLSDDDDITKMSPIKSNAAKLTNKNNYSEVKSRLYDETDSMARKRQDGQQISPEQKRYGTDAKRVKNQRNNYSAQKTDSLTLPISKIMASQMNSTIDSQKGVAPLRSSTPRGRPTTVESFSLGKMRVPRINQDETPRAKSPRNATQVSMGKVVVPRVGEERPIGETFRRTAKQAWNSLNRQDRTRNASGTKSQQNSKRSYIGAFNTVSPKFASQEGALPQVIDHHSDEDSQKGKKFETKTNANGKGTYQVQIENQPTIEVEEMDHYQAVADEVRRMMEQKELEDNFNTNFTSKRFEKDSQTLKSRAAQNSIHKDAIDLSFTPKVNRPISSRNKSYTRKDQRASTKRLKKERANYGASHVKPGAFD